MMCTTDEKKKKGATAIVFHPLSLSLRDRFFHSDNRGPIRSGLMLFEIEIALLFAGSENEGGRREPTCRPDRFQIVTRGRLIQSRIVSQRFAMCVKRKLKVVARFGSNTIKMYTP